MAEQLSKLRPDRDLQCYFFQPSAVAALSQASPTGFVISGCWRQQFDWAVLEWNRDNVFEHPLLRNLPDGDLSGVLLTYQETRTNCIPLDSDLYPTVDWPYLRIWADANGKETIYRVPLAQYAIPAGSYTPATVQFELAGAVTPGDYIELAWLDQHFNYRIASGDSLSSAVSALASAITTNQTTGKVSATSNGPRITLNYLGMPGSNGNRLGVYGTVHGAGTESGTPGWGLFSGGVSPKTWNINLNFSDLRDENAVHVPTNSIRKLRWTWSADLQPEDFERSEFSVEVANWSVSGTNLSYSVAGAGSRRIEDDDLAISYQGTWTEERGNYSGGSIRWTTVPGSKLQCNYSLGGAHTLYLGTQITDGAAQISVQVDAKTPISINLKQTAEDVLLRVPLGQMSGQVPHTVTVTHTGSAGSYFYFDFLEAAVPATDLPVFDAVAATSLATDWDTLHSQALAAERTAWLIHTLGFHGRVNHYAGALWFYELHCPANRYAAATITFGGAPEFGKTTSVSLGPTQIEHVNLIGDTAESTAKCFELLINAGSTGVWAQANGAVLTITARAIGLSGNGLTIMASTNSTEPGKLSAAVSGPLSGGVEGKWLTDLNSTQRLNRAARDWSVSFFAALKGYGVEVTSSFSMELGNGDDTSATGIAQRYPDGSAVWLNTPALQTNFSPVSTAFWQQVYADMAGLMVQAGVAPYLQFGEVQWWYFAGGSGAAAGMPFYDAYTTSAFQAAYGRTMAVIPSQDCDPRPFADESVFLPGLIGTFTQAVAAFVRQSYPGTRFEVLYPPDVNNTALNQIVNYPVAVWTPANLACLKTENFTYTGDRNLDQARESIQLPAQLGFPASQSSHLVGISDYTTAWIKERNLAVAAGVESVVLFALDQFCLIGYGVPLTAGPGRSQFQGG